MPDNVLFLNAVRKEDFLSITFELRNLQPQGAPPRLVRSNPDLPAFVIVHFPPQHVQEQSFFQDTTRLPAGPVPVQGMLSGGSRLAFQLPPAQDGLDFTLQALLDWTNLEPSLPVNALPAGANINGDLPSPPGLAEPAATQTAIEFPSALILSPDADAGWAHAVQQVTHAGRTELWHTRLGSYLRLPGDRRLFFEPGRLADKLGLHPHVRAVWYRDGNILNDPVNLPSLTAKDRQEIANLSGNFQIRAKIPLWVLVVGHGGGLTRASRVKQWLVENHLPAFYVPKAIPTRRLMLTSAGAWANLEGSWDFPVITNPDLINEHVYPSISLQQWQHIAAGGRDNYVRVVRRGYMCPTGNRAVQVTITERVFEPQQVRVEHGPQGDFSVFGAVAYLRQYEVIVIQEPLRIFSNFEQAFKSERREMLYRKLTILTRVTPLLDQHGPAGASFFPKVGGSEYKFKISAEDNDGQMSNFEIPLRFVPAEDAALSTAVGDYNDAAVWLRTAETHNQTMAFTASSPDKPGDGVLKFQSLTFKAQAVDSAHGKWLPSPTDPYFLPEIDSAQVGIPAVERLLGNSAPVTIQYDLTYLANGFRADANKGEVFATLTNPLPLPFSTEKGGGVARPQADIKGLSRALGPVSNPVQALAGKVDTSVFNNARLLGSIPLVDLLLPNPTFEKADFDITHLPEDQLAAWLEDIDHLLKLPVLVTRQVQNPPAVETIYLWKPAIKPVTIGILTLQTSGVFPDANADMLLRARLLTLLDGGKSIMTIFGRLRNFALDFAGILSLNVRSLSFTAEQGKKVDLSAEGVDLVFRGPLEFVNTLKDILPANGFSDPPFLNVDTSGITAGYSLGVPSVGVGIFSIQNIALSAALSLPFIDRPAGVRFAISERHKPFLVTVTLFGGGGFFALALNANGLEQIEAAIEFGGNISINLGVASGGVYVMAGIYFSLTPKEVKLTGYLRVGGSLEVLGLICISIEFYLGFTYRSKSGGGGEVWGQATVTVEVEVLCFSKSVSMTVEKRFAGAAGDPTFEQVVAPPDWEEYVLAFA